MATLGPSSKSMRGRTNCLRWRRRLELLGLVVIASIFSTCVAGDQRPVGCSEAACVRRLFLHDLAPVFLLYVNGSASGIIIQVRAHTVTSLRLRSLFCS